MQGMNSVSSDKLLPIWELSRIFHCAQGKFIPFRDVFESEEVVPTNEFVGFWSSSPPGMYRTLIG